MRAGRESGTPRARGTFTPLLVSLAGALMLAPLVRGHPLITSLLVSVLVLASLFALLDKKGGSRAILSAVVFVALTVRWGGHVLGEAYPGLVVAAHATTSAFFGLLTGMVVVNVLGVRRVTTNTVLGAVCGYLLIAYAFGFAYGVMMEFDGRALASPSFAGNPGLGQGEIGASNVDLVYFSFTTLTTLGYGDIIPVSPVARSLVILEVLCGQLYLAAFVARLVGALAAPGGDRDAPGGP